jgi:hypothetical protein
MDAHASTPIEAGPRLIKTIAEVLNNEEDRAATLGGPGGDVAQHIVSFFCARGSRGVRELVWAHKRRAKRTKVGLAAATVKCARRGKIRHRASEGCFLITHTVMQAFASQTTSCASIGRGEPLAAEPGEIAKGPSNRQPLP